MEQTGTDVNEISDIPCESFQIPEYGYMHLSRFLQLNAMSLREFARRCGTSASTMVRVRDQTVVPSRRVLEAICRETGGAVTVGELIQVGGPARVEPIANLQSPGPTSVQHGDEDSDQACLVRDERKVGGA